MLHVNILERLRCNNCQKGFLFANPDVRIDPGFVALCPVPKQDVCNACLRTKIEECPEMREQYHTHLRAVTAFNLKCQLLAG